jgi:hypothetical protein
MLRTANTIIIKKIFINVTSIPAKRRSERKPITKYWSLIESTDNILSLPDKKLASGDKTISPSPKMPESV